MPSHAFCSPWRWRLVLGLCFGFYFSAHPAQAAPDLNPAVTFQAPLRSSVPAVVRPPGFGCAAVGLWETLQAWWPRIRKAWIEWQLPALTDPTPFGYPRTFANSV